MNPQLNDYFNKKDKWQTVCNQLRALVLECGLTEELKWRNPCYTFQNHNIVLIGKFKEYCSLSFFKGVLLQDEHELLVSPGENSQSVRLIKFTDSQQIEALKPILKATIFEAIELEKAGIKVELKQSTNLTFPEELITLLNQNPKLKSAFESLTPGRQRGYNLHFSAPKQAQTRISRIEKCMDRILSGKGLHDCICGHSKRLPTCDGSHKYI